MIQNIEDLIIPGYNHIDTKVMYPNNLKSNINMS